MLENNVYKTLAKAEWENGENSKVVAQNLALALAYILAQVVGNHPKALAKEFKRLISEQGKASRKSSQTGNG